MADLGGEAGGGAQDPEAVPPVEGYGACSSISPLAWTAHVPVCCWGPGYKRFLLMHDVCIIDGPLADVPLDRPRPGLPFHIDHR